MSQGRTEDRSVPPLLMDIGRAATELGTLPGFAFLLLGVAAADPMLALRALAVLVLAEATCQALKALFRIERPGAPRPASRHAHDAGYSFPSCHALNSAATLGFLAAESGSAIVTALLILFLLLISLSRLVLGHHRVVDIAAGLALGTAWQIGLRAVFW